jgi:hypothetical protein
LTHLALQASRCAHTVVNVVCMWSGIKIKYCLYVRMIALHKTNITYNHLHIWMLAHQKIKLSGVAHCFAWHVQVNLGFYFNFKIEEFVHSGLYALWHLGHNSIFTFSRIKILLWKINK